jgi:hypothetical protein
MLVAVFLSALSGLQSATLLISDNFDAYTPGVLPTGGSSLWNKYNTVDDNDSRFTRIVVDDGQLFGAGSSNQYLRLADTSNANGNAGYFVLNNSAANIGTTGTVAFDFYSSSIPGSQGDGWLFTLGTNSGNGNTAFGFFVGNGGVYSASGNGVTKDSGALATIQEGAACSLVVYFNNSTTSESYLPGYTLGAGKMDIWLNGNRIGSNLARAGSLADGSSLTHLVIAQKYSTTSTYDFVGELFIDNLQIFSGFEAALVPVPESAMFSLAMGGLLLGAATLYRRVW